LIQGRGAKLAWHQLFGPRQVGKTTLAKALDGSYEYLNYDRLNHRKKIIKEDWGKAIRFTQYSSLNYGTFRWKKEGTKGLSSSFFHTFQSIKDENTD
jgi:hypothetical protein